MTPGFSKFSSAPGDGKMPAEKLTRMLVAAILKNDAGGIANMLAMGADPNRSDDKGNSPLTIAATDPRELGALRALLDAKVDPNVASANGRLPLHSVLRMKDERIMPEALEMLLTAKANPNLMHKGSDGRPRTALQAAMGAERSDKIISLLIQGGADVLLGEDAATGALSPLHVFARTGRYMLLELSFGYGADIERRDFAGRTCLLWAAQEGMARSIETLLERGADPTAKDNEGKDPIAHARLLPAEEGRGTILRMLTRAARDFEVKREIKDLRTTLDGLRNAVNQALSAADELKGEKT